MRLLIKGGQAVLPTGLCQADVLVDEGKIQRIGQDIQDSQAQVLDAKGWILGPGLVDIHCHLREPGYEYKETIQTGAQAAAHGGFTSICCMANTKPINDTAAVTVFIRSQAQHADAKVYPIAAVTKGLKGEELTEMGELKAAGAVAFSDDGVPVKDAQRMRLALQYAKAFHMPIVSHAEEPQLAASGVMNEGYWSTVLGLPGIPAAAEEVAIARDCLLAGSVDGQLHIAHVSTKGSVEIIRQAKRQGIRVTCETAPHYLLGTDEMVSDYDTNTRVNPPLRTQADQQALIEGLKDGTIDCIATDHAPHHRDEKEVEYALAASGISGFETALGICWTTLVTPGHLTPEALFDKMSTAPAAIFNLPAGRLEEGAAADMVLIDPDAEWTVDVQRFVSLGQNNPFHGQTLKAQVAATLLDGRLVYKR